MLPSTTYMLVMLLTITNYIFLITCFDFQQSKRRDRITGVDSVQYTIISTNNLTIEDAPVQMLNVNLYCDLDFTPYCITPEQLQLYEGGSLTRAHGYLSKKPR